MREEHSVRVKFFRKFNHELFRELVKLCSLAQLLLIKSCSCGGRGGKVKLNTAGQLLTVPETVLTNT